MTQIKDMVIALHNDNPTPDYRSTRGMNPRLAREFEAMFHVPLAKYWQGVLGFDVTGFDDEVIKSGNMSMRDAARQTYGVDAVVLLERLLGMRS